MNARLATSREASERTRFVERVAERSGSGLLIALGALELGVAVTLIAGGTITRYHLLPFAAVLLATWLYRGEAAVDSDRRVGVGAAALSSSLLVVFASFVLAGSTLDLSPDGQTAHLLRISHLASGWNPVYNAEFTDQPDDYILAGAETRFVESGLGPYMAAASASELLGDIEYGKGINLILMGAVMLLALATALGAHLRPGIAVVVALTAALNPVSVVQSLTNYVDGQIGALIACLVFLTMILARRPAIWTTTAWVAALALLINAKVTGIAFALIIGSGALAFLLWRGFSPRRGVASYCAGLALGIGVIGFNAYVLVLVRHGRIFGARDLDLLVNLRLVVVTVALATLGGAVYWLLRRRDMLERFRGLAGPRVVALGLGAAFIVSLVLIGGLAGEVPSFMRFATLVESDDLGLLVQPSGKVAQAVGSIFSESAVMLATYDNVSGPTGYRIKIPFEVRSDELSSYRHLNPDHRVGGFGPWMSGAFLVACSILLLMWLRGSESRSELGFWLTLILATVLLFPEPWWARHVPQAWLVPVLVAAYGCRPTNRRATRRLAQILLVILSINAGMVLYEHGRGQVALQSAVHRTMVALRRLPQPVPVYFSNFHSAVFRFHDYGIAFVDTPASDCPRYLKMLRSGVRVCAESPEGSGWQEALAQAQAIDADLAGAGIEGFRVVPPDPRDRIVLLESDIQSLVEKGELMAQQGRELVRSLRRTGRFLDRLEDTKAMESLVVYGQSVLSLMDSEALSPGAAFRLLDSASATGLPIDNPFAGFSIRIDVSESGRGLFDVDGVGGFTESTGPVHFVLMPGRHRLTLISNRSPTEGFDFTVRADGTLEFDPSLDPLVGGRGTTVMALHGLTGISIDVTELSYGMFEVDGVGGFMGSTDPVHFALKPGPHRLGLPNGHSPEPGLDFTVQSDGTLQFDSSLDHLVGGRGTKAMALHGTQIDIDVSELSYSKYNLVGAGALAGTTDSVPLALMPGGHRVMLSTSRGLEPGLEFTVQSDGTLQFDPSLDSLVGGRGTKAMVLHGTRIDIDISKLSYSKFNLAGAGALAGTTEPMPFVLMPGAHGLALITNRKPEPGFDFTVQADGTLQFDPSLDSLVGGRGTKAMVLHGTRIDIDTSKLSYSKFNVIGVGGFAGTTAVPLVLMPGGHGLALITNRNPEPGFDFTVQADGTLQFDPSIDPLVGGRGTKALVLNGLTGISIDVSELSYTGFNLAGEGPFIGPSDPMPFVLMPGGHGLTMVTRRTPEPRLDFTVQVDGTLQFDPSLDPLVDGRGTTVIVLRGTRIDIDARGSADSLVDGLATFPVDRILGANLMPGAHGFRSPEMDFVFYVRPDLTVDYDVALDGDIFGRGTSTLVVGDAES